ncbi:MAG: signal peptide peptidase SppA [Treponema sp.]|nr:signal peptide peptidase SppA [Treponema sp.]
MKINLKLLALIILCLVSFPLFSQNTYLELNLNDSQSSNPFIQSRSLLEILTVIDRAANDKNIGGIVLVIGSINRSRDHLWELRNALEQFKESGKGICAFISHADMDIYTLASVADKIVMDELGTMSMLGYSFSALFVRQTLEKLGIGVRELRYFEYKSAGEMFSRNSRSEADRRQMNDYIDDIFNLTRDTLMKARNWTAEEFDTIVNREFIFAPRNALQRNLVDYTGRTDVIHEAVNEIEGREINRYVIYGNSNSSITGASSVYTSPRTGGFFNTPQTIAIVYANGQTDMEGGMNAILLSQTVIGLADNNRVKAIVLRINSPGGSAEAADYLAQAVLYATQKKPVVVSMGNVAASGGYWAAVYASHIVANPYTITGSIGVIGSWFYDSGLNSNLGVNVDIIQRGTHADLSAGFLFPYRDLNSHEESRYRHLLEDIYLSFIEKVSVGRNMGIDSVEAVAQGRIFSGTRALEAGLIDSVGSLTDAIRIARELAEIPEGRSVRYDEYPKPTFMDKMLGRFPVMARIFKGKSQPRATDFFMDMFIPDDIKYHLERNGQILAILPLELSIR